MEEIKIEFENLLKYKLSDFQEESIKYINEGYNVLVSAPTSMGKTTVAEYGMFYSLKKHREKQIFYTCPVKSLVNEKYYEMSKNYEKMGVTTGLLTGDFTINRDADVIICTTEILCNILTNQGKLKNKENEDIKEDNKEETKVENKEIKKEISCVIFDEVHYINDSGRGRIWEICLILCSIDKDSLIILLSATIGDQNINYLMSWLNKLNEEKQFKKVVRYVRPIPIEEYFLDFTKCRNFKKLKKKTHEEIKELREQRRQDIITDDYKEEKEIIITNDPNPEQYEVLRVNEKNYNQIKRYWSNLSDFEYSIKNEVQTLFNTVYSNENLGTPCIMFVFSKARCIEYAEMIEQSYVNHEERKEILDFYDKSLSEFKDNSQYINLRKVVSKGIGYHHSGLISVMKETMEFLIKKKLIKFVVATETISIGINYGVKTIIVSSMSKPSEEGFRDLLVSEYKQMVGRSGRLGVDTKGNIIIYMMGSKNKKYMSWNNLNNIINGKIANITSKYVIEPIFVLKNLEDRVHTVVSNNSLAYYKSFRSKKKEIIVPPKLTKIYNLKMQMIELEKNGLSCNMKSYNKLYKALSNDEKQEFELILKTQKENELKTDLDYYDDFERDIYNFLLNNNFIEENEGKYILTEKGNLAELFTEINPIIFVNDKEFILKEDVLPTLSMFIDDGLKESEDNVENYDNETIQYFMDKAVTTYSEYIDKYPKWTFYPKNYVFLSYWLSDENISLDQAVKDFGYDMGTITKVLIKMYQVSEELINNLIKINRTDMTEYVVQQRSLLIRYPLRLESLYVNN